MPLLHNGVELTPILSECQVELPCIVNRRTTIAVVLHALMHSKVIRRLSASNKYKLGAAPVRCLNLRVAMISRAGLRTVVHHQHLNLLLLIFYKQPRINRVKVTADSDLLVLLPRVKISLVQINIMLDNPVSVCISIEHAMTVQLMCSEVHRHFLAKLMPFLVNRPEKDVEFSIVRLVLRQLHLDLCQWANSIQVGKHEHLHLLPIVDFDVLELMLVRL